MSEPVLSVTIGEVTRELAAIKVGVRTVPLVEFVGDAELTNSAAQEMLGIIPEGTEIFLTVATNALPIAHELSDRSGIPYVCARKSRRTYMRNPLILDAESMTLGVGETLWLDRHHANRLQGKKVTIVQDVVASGNTAKALGRFVELSGGTVAGYIAAFQQGETDVPLRVLQQLPTCISDYKTSEQ